MSEGFCLLEFYDVSERDARVWLPQGARRTLEAGQRNLEVVSRYGAISVRCCQNLNRYQRLSQR